MSPQEMKEACIAMALAPTWRGRDYIFISNTPVFVRYKRVMDFVGRELGRGFTFDDKTTYNEDALVVLEWLNKRYPEG